MSLLISLEESIMNCVCSSNLYALKILLENESIDISVLELTLQNHIPRIRYEEIANVLTNNGSMKKYSLKTLDSFLFLYVRNNWKDSQKKIMELIDNGACLTRHGNLEICYLCEENIKFVINYARDKIDEHSFTHILDCWYMGKWSRNTLQMILEHIKIDKYKCLKLPDDIFDSHITDLSFSVNDMIYAMRFCTPHKLKMIYENNDFTDHNIILCAASIIVDNSYGYNYFVDYLKNDNDAIFSAILLSSSACYAILFKKLLDELVPTNEQLLYLRINTSLLTEKTSRLSKYINNDFRQRLMLIDFTNYAAQVEPIHCGIYREIISSMGLFTPLDHVKNKDNTHIIQSVEKYLNLCSKFDIDTMFK